MVESDVEDFYSSDEESNNKNLSLSKNKVQQFDRFGTDSDDENDENDENDSNDDNGSDDDDDDDDDFDNELHSTKKSANSFLDKSQNESDDDGDDLDDDIEDELHDDLEDKDNNDISETAKFLEKNLTGSTTFGTKKVKKLTPKQLEKEERRIKKTGVVYLSSLPPYMKPQKLRQIMSRFGEVGRIFLKPEDPKVYKSRIKSGGNKKKKFDEGWIEFADKANAKLAANTLNGNILGGKKRSFYHDDVMNVKYLKGFKWFDLTNALNREVEVRESKKQAELSQAHKLNKAYIKNVETSKTIKRVKQSKKRKLEDDSNNDNTNNDHKPKEIRRNFKQRNVATNRADADDNIKTKQSSTTINNVLDSIF